jgi:hypothetical protein
MDDDALLSWSGMYLSTCTHLRVAARGGSLAQVGGHSDVLAGGHCRPCHRINRIDLLLDFFCPPARPYDYISHPSGLCDHYAASYCSGTEPCTAKVFPPRLGVDPGSFFNTVHRSTLPLASAGILLWLFKVDTVMLKLAQIGGGSS